VLYKSIIYIAINPSQLLSSKWTLTRSLSAQLM